MQRLFKYWDMFWIYSDEGFNLIKSMMLMKGYHLYTEIWSDQPPLLTYVLSVLFRYTGFEVRPGRVMILMVTCILIWAVVQFTRQAWGDLPAIATAILLPLLPSFIGLSAAVLVGQPSICFATLSMFSLAGWHRMRKTYFLLFSGIALGASIMTKMFTGFLIPAFACGLLISEYYYQKDARNWRYIFRPLVIWGIAFFAASIVIGYPALNQSGIQQLIGTPWRASFSGVSIPEVGTNTILPYLRESTFLLVLSTIGGILAIRQHRWLMVYPIAWMLLAFISLMIIKPVWGHQQMLITIPAVILAGGAVGCSAMLVINLWQGSSRQLFPILLLALVGIFLVGFLYQRIPSTLSLFRAPGTPLPETRLSFESKAINRIERFAPQTNWMVTDAPMYAFRAGLAVPPSLAVISGKRIASGDLTEEEIIKTISQYQPEQVLLTRFDFPHLRAYLAEGYHVNLKKDDGTTLYLRKDLSR